MNKMNPWLVTGLAIIVLVVAGRGYELMMATGEPTKLIHVSNPVNTPITHEILDSTSKEVSIESSGTVIIQQLSLGSDQVFLVASSSVPESSTFHKEANCSLPEVEEMNTFLKYKGQLISLGKIGIPKKMNGAYPEIVNPRDAGMDYFQAPQIWSPLVLTQHGIIVIDYSTVRVDTSHLHSTTFSENKTCYLNWGKMQLYQVDFECTGPGRCKEKNSLILRDTDSGTDMLNFLRKFEGAEYDSPAQGLHCDLRGCG